MRHIQAAFGASSQALLRLLQHDLGLNHTLAALKHYFLLDKGDLLLSFLDSAEEELAKPAAQVSVIRLQSLLDLGEYLLATHNLSPHDVLSLYWLSGGMLIQMQSLISCRSADISRLHKHVVFRFLHYIGML